MFVSVSAVACVRAGYAAPQGRHKRATNPERQRNKLKSLISLIPRKIFQLYTSSECGSVHTERDAAKVTISSSHYRAKRTQSSMKHDNEIPHASRQIGSSVQKGRLSSCLMTATTWTSDNVLHDQQQEHLLVSLGKNVVSVIRRGSGVEGGRATEECSRWRGSI